MSVMWDQTAHQASVMRCRLLSLSSQAIQHAEDTRDQVMSMTTKALQCAEASLSSKARHHAEEAREQVMSMTTKMLHCAEETKDQLMSLSNKACFHAEEARDQFVSMSNSALHCAEEMAQSAWNAGWTAMQHSSLPGWLRNNEHIVSGHRPPFNCYFACFRSIFEIHTETANIWSHLIGWLTFIFITVHFMTKSTYDITWHDNLVLTAYCFSAVTCFGFSWTYHTVCCHSEPVGRLFCKLDYCGIALLVTGSTIPWLHYSFQSDDTSRVTYIALTSTFCILCVIVTLSDQFSQVSYHIRAGVFMCLGSCGIFPVSIQIVRNGLHQSVIIPVLPWFLLMLFLYFLGALLYAIRFPECLWPGKFDIWFSSHQLFHILVLMATLANCHAIFIVTYRCRFLEHCVSSDI